MISKLRSCIPSFRICGPLLLTLVYALLSGKESRTTPRVDPPSLLPPSVALEVHSGDLIFRRRTSLLSRAVLAADSAGEFSHVGIAWNAPGGTKVVHARPPLRRGEQGEVVLELLASFLAPTRTKAAAIYRVRSAYLGAAEKAAAAALRYHHLGVEFDGDFDLETTDALYCSELVWAAYREAGLDLTGGRREAISLPFRSGLFIFPSTLRRSELLTTIYNSSVPGLLGGSPSLRASFKDNRSPPLD